MRKLSMKSKRGKSGTSSDGDSEENGVGVNAAGGNDTSSEHAASKSEKKTPKKGRRSGAETNKQSEAADDHKKEEENGSSAKKRKKDGQKASTSEGEPIEKEYEVLQVVGHRLMKGRRQFLVRWKGYNEDSDTWEQEKNLNCPQLIEEYLAETAESSGTEKSPKTPKIPKERKETTKPKTLRSGNKKKAATDAQAENSLQDNKDGDGDKDGEETKEFEVEKILEVHFHKKNNKRDFLIRWKGFSPAEDTWEPEENLNCPELISKFMDKVDNAKQTDLRELRTNPAHTKRYTLMSTEHGRRLSRRNMNKQRATYHQCDE